jgi:hypothetical protein
MMTTREVNGVCSFFSFVILFFPKSICQKKSQFTLGSPPQKKAAQEGREAIMEPY